MKKITLNLLCIVLVSTVSCSKKNIHSTDSAQNGFSIKAYVAEGEITKTSYENEKTFSWLGNECLSMQLINNQTGKRDRWIFYNDTEGGGPTATFKSSGSLSTDTWGLGDYAFYPIPGNSYCPAGNNTFNAGKVETNKTEKGLTIYNDFKSSVSNPLQFLPLIGCKDSEGNFVFHSATGILKITINNIDSRLSKVRVSSEGQKLNGTFTMTDSGTSSYIAMDGTTTPSEYAIDAQYTDWSNETSLPFYFPIPVGTLKSGFTVNLLDENENILRTVTAPSDVKIERNKISEIKTAINMPPNYTAALSIAGTSKSITVSLADKGDSANTIKVGIGASEDAALNSASSSPIATFTSTSDAATVISAGLTSSGKYYVAYSSFDSSNTLRYSAVSDVVYFITAGDSAALPGTYYIGNSSDYQLVFAESSDPTRGNILISAYPTWSLSGTLYGVYDDSAKTMTFDGSQVFNQDSNGTYYCVHGQGRDGIIRDVIFSVANSSGKYKLTPTGAFGIGKATVADGIATKYTATKHVWNSTDLYQQ